MLDPGAFSERVRSRLVGSLTLYCGDRYLAEELAQEALARAWERWPAVSRMASPEAWTFRTAVNLANSRFRRRRAERRAHERARAGGGEEAVERDDATILAVREAVAALAPRQRAVVVMRWFLGYDVAETAELLGCAPGTVKSTTHQALAQLRGSGLFEGAGAAGLASGARPVGVGGAARAGGAGGTAGRPAVTLLDAIASPADLRRLDPAQLPTLAQELRDVIVRSVAVTGGHLGSNLGTVELTIAVHRVFESPDDVVLWDTGHQAYAHKLLTGRRDGFAHLRQAGGLSGYPSRAESEHDWVENSHASTILSYAYGMATALDLGGDRTLDGERGRRVVAVIGDGSMTGGMAYEALNNLGHSQRRCVIVLNDNGRSYAPTISRLTESVSRLRLHPGYVRRKERLEELIRRVPALGGPLDRARKGVEAAFREVLEPTAFFESLGVRYTGPIDGHDIAGLERALADAAEFDGPIVVHVLTHKGRGYQPAEDDDEQCLHDVSVFDPATGPVPSSGSTVTYTEAFAKAIIEAAERDPKLVAITAAMPGPTGLLAFQERFPDRYVDVGIAEQHAVTAAAGMAMGGLHPVAAIYSTFLTRAFDQVTYDVALHGEKVLFAVDRAGITGENGPSHHGVLDLALLLTVPGMTVLAPSSAQDLEVMVHDALALCDGPAAIRYPRGAARLVPPDEVGSGLRARRLRQGGDACILAVGRLVEAALGAADLLAAEGVEATVWDVRVVKPLDEAMLADAARHPLVVTAEDGIRVGGAGTVIAQAIAEGPGAPPVVTLGTPPEFIPHGTPTQILADLALDARGLATTITKSLTRTPTPTP